MLVTLCSLAVNLIALATIYCHDEYDNLVVDHLVNQAVTTTT